ncbi:cell envelope biogenesis protein TolA [Ralstonia soli]|uniref:Cell envelope biogenesis protein TolA n=1 Tax=Ralstonia soli TaxID=2953896 RepID=A0ABT1AE38_9RALS|nr:cell envelope biogenesis protein TolA [Ralstonia soli]MCO5396652.1 cell envelope biogenesis protein TolA [Ralstonia soli]
MARTPIAFPDDQLHAIQLAVQQLAVRYPDNRLFLARAIEEIDRIAGRSFGQKVYRRLLVAAGVARTPSTATFQAVLDDRRAATETAEGEVVDVTEGREDSVQAFVRKEVRVALQDWAPSAPPSSIEGEGAAAWLAEHCERLEVDNRALREQLQVAQTEAAVARAREEAASALFAQVQAGASARERELVDRLARAPEELQALAARLEGAERRRLVETDAMRQALRDERSGFVARIETLERELASTRTALEVYRRGAGSITTGR